MWDNLISIKFDEPFQFNNDDDNNEYWGNEEQGWSTNIEYTMKTDGLYKADGKKATDNDNNDEGDDDKASRKQEKMQQKLDSMQHQLDRQKDSIDNQLKKKGQNLKPTHQDAFMAPVGLSRFTSLL